MNQYISQHNFWELSALSWDVSDIYKKRESYVREWTEEHTGVWTVSNSGKTYVTNMKINSWLPLFYSLW